MLSLSEKVWSVLPYCLTISNYDDYCKIKKNYNENMPILPFIYNKFGYETTYYVLNRLGSPNLYKQILNEEQFIISEEKSYIF